MILVLRPSGRGNWRPLVLAVHSGPVELLFPALRDGPVKVGDTWEIQGRQWRVSAVDQPTWPRAEVRA